MFRGPAKGLALSRRDFQRSAPAALGRKLRAFDQFHFSFSVVSVNRRYPGLCRDVITLLAETLQVYPGNHLMSWREITRAVSAVLRRENCAHVTGTRAGALPIRRFVLNPLWGLNRNLVRRKGMTVGRG